MLGASGFFRHHLKPNEGLEPPDFLGDLYLLNVGNKGTWHPCWASEPPDFGSRSLACWGTYQACWNECITSCLSKGLLPSLGQENRG